MWKYDFFSYINRIFEDIFCSFLHLFACLFLHVCKILLKIALKQEVFVTKLHYKRGLSMHMHTLNDNTVSKSYPFCDKKIPNGNIKIIVIHYSSSTKSEFETVCRTLIQTCFNTSYVFFSQLHLPYVCSCCFMSCAWCILQKEVNITLYITVL